MGKRQQLPEGPSQSQEASTALAMQKLPEWEQGVRAEDAGDQPMSGLKPKVAVDASGRVVSLNDPDPELPRNYAMELAKREAEKDARGLSPDGGGEITLPELKTDRAFASLPAELPAAAGFAGLSQQDMARMRSTPFQRGVMNQVFGLLGLRLSRFPEPVRDRIWKNIEGAVAAFCEDEERVLEACLRNLSILSDGSWGPTKVMPMLVALVGCGAVLDVIIEHSPLESIAG